MTLKRYTRLRRTTPMKRANRRRRAARLARDFGVQAAYCRTQPCCACGAAPPSDPHHEPSRGAGGTDEDTVPLCRRCHGNRHGMGRAWLEDTTGVRLDEVKRRMREAVAA